MSEQIIQFWNKISDVLPYDEWRCECGTLCNSYRINLLFFVGESDEAWVAGVPIGDKGGLCFECAVRRLKEQQMSLPAFHKAVCRDCGEQLTNENWHASHRDRRSRICKACYKESKG